MQEEKTLGREDYLKMSDNDLIKEIRSGNHNAQNILLQRYKPLVQIKSRRFFIVGAEEDDIVQEGMIGLYKAVKMYDYEKENSFKTFANLCIERQLITAIKTSNRQKHIPLNTSFSLNDSAYEENDELSVIDILDANVVEDPLETITRNESKDLIEKRIYNELSSMEKNVLDRYLDGYSYNSIATQLDMTPKAIDNAIQRIRKKAQKTLSDIG